MVHPHDAGCPELYWALHYAVFSSVNYSLAYRIYQFPLISSTYLQPKEWKELSEDFFINGKHTDVELT